MSLNKVSYRLSLAIAVLVAAGSANAFSLAKGVAGQFASRDRAMSAINPAKMCLPGVVIVKFKPGVRASMQELFKVPGFQRRIVAEANPASMKSLLGVMGMRLDKTSEILNDIYVVHYTSTVTPALMAKSIMMNPDIEYAVPHYIYKVDKLDFTPNDSLLSTQYALSLIKAFSAWNITEGDSSVIVGIVDTGVNWMHPDLFPNIWQNPNWRTDTKYPGDSIGWDFGGTNGTPDNNPEEDYPPPYEHGTHVAGIVAAVANNKIGIAGVAPKCKIMAVKASEKDLVDQNGEPYIVYGFEGIIYAADHGARVINCSWGGVGYSPYEQDVIDYATAKGALVVAAAGNDHSEEFQTPAYYRNVLSVAATDQNDNAAYFTNYSYNVSVSAPGVNIMSTWGTDSYTELSGTSMASPCAAGVAALVASEHPNYAPQQILEQVRVSSDNIYDNNPTYFDMLGFGRVDAYNALTVSSPGVMITDVTPSDSVGGNNDGVFTDGETVQVLGNATDWLSPTTNLQLTLTTTDPYITIVNATENIGALSTDSTFNMAKNPLSFKINSNAPLEHVATFLIKITDGSYSDYRAFTVLINPTFRNLDINNILTTVTSKGNIGFNDYPNNTQGAGFQFLPDKDSLLFEGAFMAATSPTHVVDEARDSTANEEDNDFAPMGLVTVETPGPVADQESIAMFNDSNSVNNRIGIRVTLHTYAFKADSASGLVLLRYQIHNLNSVSISNFYAGLFLDWDIGANGQNNDAAYDSTYQLGYAYNVTRVPRTYCGCALLSGGKINYTAIDNASSTSGIYNGFSKLQKWQALSGGTVNSFAGPSDISMVVSGGPVSILPDTSVTMTFALVAGDTLQDLERAVSVARQILSGIDSTVAIPSLKNLAELYQNYPNPFNPSTNIAFALKANSRVSITVYNVIGQKVRTLTDRSYSAGGPYNTIFSAEGLSSGVYFVRLIATSNGHSYVQTRKMMVLK